MPSRRQRNPRRKARPLLMRIRNLETHQDEGEGVYVHTFWDGIQNKPLNAFCNLTLLVGTDQYRMECHKMFLYACPFIQKRFEFGNINHQTVEIDKDGSEGLSREVVRAVVKYNYLALSFFTPDTVPLYLLTEQNHHHHHQQDHHHQQQQDNHHQQQQDHQQQQQDHQSSEDSTGMVMDIFRLALTWELPHLAKICAIHLAAKDINLANYEELLLFAEKEKVEKVWLSVREFIQKNVNHIHRKVTDSRLGSTRGTIISS